MKKAVSIIMLIVLLVSMPSSVFAAKFNLGDTVEVYNTGASGLVVRDAPAGNAIGKKYDGDRGVVIAGPQNAYLGGVLYTWWKVRWASDSLEGWSAENWLMRVPPDLTVEDIWIYPESFNPGSAVTIYTRIRNIGAGAAVSGQGLWINAYFDGGLCYQEGIEGLGAGYAYTFQWGYTWPSNTNWHTIEVRADPSNYITESNEGNNIRSESFQATAPPNQPPTLYNGYVTPSSGDTSTTFSYYVTYSDQEGDVPTTKYVYIDGSPYTMTKISGDYVSGAVFRYSTTLSAGSHNYYFYFADSVHSHTVRLPTPGTYSGPTVSVTPEYRTLTVYSSPSGVSFTANGVSHTTPWSGAYSQGTSVNLVMPSVHSGGDARYNWDKWSDGVTSSSRTIVLNSDTTVTGNYIGPYYELTVASSPISGIQFIINGASKTTSYSEWLYQGYYTIEMPITYNGYTWQSWLEDGSTSRTRNVLLNTAVSLTAIYVIPSVPDFSILASPTSLSIQQGSSGSSTITITSISGFSQPVKLSTSGVYGVEIALSPGQVTPLPDSSTTSTLTLSAFTWATPGQYTLTVTATNGSLTHNMYISLQITTARFEKHLQILTRPYLPIGELTAKYGYSDGNYGEKLYKISEIQIKLIGFAGRYHLFIRDQQKNTLWEESGLCAKSLTKSFSFESSPLTVDDSDEVGLSLQGIDELTAIVKPYLSAANWYIKAAQDVLFGPYAILIPSSLLKKMLAPEEYKMWEASPIAFTKSSVTQFYPESSEMPESLQMPSLQIFQICSPGELNIRDSEGRVTGLVNGEAKEEIPNSVYCNDTVIILSPIDVYVSEVVGTKYGTYGLVFASFLQEENSNFTAANIPISPEAMHQYAINWTALSHSEDAVDVQVDSNRDGVFEYNFTSDGELTRHEYVLATTKHDLGVTEIAPSKTLIGQGYNLPLNATIINYGAYTETFNVTIYVNTTLLALQAVTLASGNSTAIICMWNTSGFAKGKYTISVVADNVTSETYTIDNTMTTGVITITIPGDVDDNFEVDIYDITAICVCYNSEIGEPLYYPNCDVDGNGIIDIFDVTTACITYGQKYP